MYLCEPVVATQRIAKITTYSLALYTKLFEWQKIYYVG